MPSCNSLIVIHRVLAAELFAAHNVLNPPVNLNLPKNASVSGGEHFSPFAGSLL